MAYFPILKESHLKQTISQERLRKLRRDLYHWALGVILAPLKPLSHTGVKLPDPSGTMQHVYPELLVFVCDHPEAMLISGKFDSPKTAFPCDQCLCPSDQLADVSIKHPLQHESDQRDKYEKVKGGAVRSADVSQHLVQCGQWGFFGGDTEFSACTGNDLMHNEVGSLSCCSLTG